MSVLPFAMGFLLGYMIAAEQRLEGQLRRAKDRRRAARRSW